MKKLTAFILTALLLLTPAYAYANNSGNVINATDFGANGASNEDQTEYFTAALNAAAPGDTVFVPNGSYSISSIKVPTGVTLCGESREGTVLSVNKSDAYAVQAHTVSNVQIKNLTVDGNMIAKHLIYIKSAVGTVIDNVFLCNVPHGSLVTGIYINGRCKNTVIKNSVIKNIGVRPSGDETEDKGTGILIYGNYMFSYNYPDDVLIENNVINMTGRTGIAANQADGIVISSNTIKNTGTVIGTGLGIEIYGAECKNCIIENNTVDHWISMHGTTHAIRNNKIGTAFFEDEDYFKRYAIENGASNTVYAGNELSGGNKYGIIDLGGTNVMYTDTSVTDAAQAAYSLGYGTAAPGHAYRYFYNCSFNNTSKNTENAIYPSSSGMGIELNDNNMYLVFDKVTANNNARYGVHIKGLSGYIEFKNSSICNNSVAFTISGTQSPIELINTEVSGNTTNTVKDTNPFTSAAPTADFETEKTTYTTGESITFTNKSTVCENAEATVFLWDMGNGLPQTTPNAEYAYSTAGVYTVTLTVWDSLGRGSIVRKQITVENPAEPDETTTQPFPDETTTQPPANETTTQPQPDETSTAPTQNGNNSENEKSFFVRIIDWIKSIIKKIASFFGK